MVLPTAYKNVPSVRQSSDNAPSKSALLHGNLRTPNPIVKKQEGNWQWLENGTKFFDACGGAAVACLGYGNKRVIQAKKDQDDTVAICNDISFRTDVGEALAQALVDSTGGEMVRAFICNSGSDAIEGSAKAVRQYHWIRGDTDRTHFICRHQSYHGSTLGALSLSGHKARRTIYEAMLAKNVSFVSACNQYRKPDISDEEYITQLADELRREFKRVGPKNVAAFVAEPVVGAALGCMPGLPGYLNAMKRVCEEFGALFIADEIMCGIGRCGTMHAWQQEDGFVPDIQTNAKGLGGGYAAVASILVSRHVAEVIEEGDGEFAHGHTYQGQPSACAAGLEVLKIIQEDNLLDNVRKMGKLLEAGLNQRLGSHPNVGDIRGQGLFWAIEFVKDKLTKKPFPRPFHIAKKIQQLALTPEYEMYFYIGTGCADDGIEGDHIHITPAFNITESDVAHIVKTVGRVIEDFFDEINLLSKGTNDRGEDEDEDEDEEEEDEDVNKKPATTVHKLLNTFTTCFLTVSRWRFS